MKPIDRDLVARQAEASAAAGKQLGVNSWACRGKKLKRGEVVHRDLLALASRNRKEVVVENCRRGHYR